METTPALSGPESALSPATAAGRCPVDHRALAAGCPVHLAGTSAPSERSRADRVVRALLRIDDRPGGGSTAAAYATFRRSMTISALRCTLTYVIFPFVLPAVGFATGVGPVLGLVIGTVAISCDVYTVRRFFAVDHKWRWPVGAICLAVIGLLSVLLVQDVVHLVT